MADGIVQLAPDSTGKKVDASELTVGANIVERQRVVIAGDTGAGALAPVTAANGLAVDVTRVQGAVASSQSGASSVTANLGTLNGAATDATLAGLQVAQGSATSGQKGALTLGAVTTSAPAYASGQTSPLSLTAGGLLRVDGSGATQPVSGTITANAGSGAFTVAQATAANLNATVVGTGTFAVQAAQAGAWTMQPGNTANTTPWLMSVSTALPTGTNSIGTVQAPTITKATQGATGFTTQDLKDAGRSSRMITLDSFAVAATAETLNTMSYSADNGTATTGTSYNVTAGKRLRVQSIAAMIHTIAGNTTAVSVIVRLRVNNAGAATITSPIQFVCAIAGVAGANSASTPVVIQVPDGYELVGGAGLAVTTACAGFVATTAAPKVDISITGYEY